VQGHIAVDLVKAVELRVNILTAVLCYVGNPGKSHGFAERRTLAGEEVN